MQNPPASLVLQNPPAPSPTSDLDEMVSADFDENPTCPPAIAIRTPEPPMSTDGHIPAGASFVSVIAYEVPMLSSMCAKISCGRKSVFSVRGHIMQNPPASLVMQNPPAPSPTSDLDEMISADFDENPTCPLAVAIRTPEPLMNIDGHIAILPAGASVASVIAYEVPTLSSMCARISIGRKSVFPVRGHIRADSSSITSHAESTCTITYQ
jgi:hypothetical protein